MAARHALLGRLSSWIVDRADATITFPSRRSTPLRRCKVGALRNVEVTAHSNAAATPADAQWRTLFTAGLLLLISDAAAGTLSRPVAAAACPDAERMQAIEHESNLEQLMKQRGIPAISVAVIKNYQIVCAKGYGVTDKGGSTPVTPATLFLAGSISKPVAALGALYLVEQGKLSLDEDVNAKLKAWKIPDNEYTRKQKVTLGLILDHTAGFTGGDFFPGYAVGEPLPSLLQILDGKPPANNDPVRVGFVPGSEWHYSGDGYLVVQQLIVDASGERFPEFMHVAVFDKLGMNDTTFAQPLPTDRAGSAAAGTLLNGTPVPHGWHVNPEMAAGGLWSTPSDLARLAIEIALSTQAKANHVLSQAMARDMLAPHQKNGVINILGSKQDPDQMGYGFFVGRKKGRFGHIGGNVGYQATFVMFADTGNGAVIMTNSDIGLAVGNILLNKIAEAYGWNYVAPPPP
jgi:CubicO group peptidase (beta-lactamase class C family)